MRVMTQWEDGASAHVLYAKCDCGTVFLEDDTVEDTNQPQLRRTFECEGCGTVYEPDWVGMTFTATDE